MHRLKWPSTRFCGNHDQLVCFIPCKFVFGCIKGWHFPFCLCKISVNRNMLKSWSLDGLKWEAGPSFMWLEGSCPGFLTLQFGSFLPCSRLPSHPDHSGILRISRRRNNLVLLQGAGEGTFHQDLAVLGAEGAGSWDIIFQPCLSPLQQHQHP